MTPSVTAAVERHQQLRHDFGDGQADWSWAGCTADHQGRLSGGRAAVSCSDSFRAALCVSRACRVRLRPCVPCRAGRRWPAAPAGRGGPLCSEAGSGSSVSTGWRSAVPGTHRSGDRRPLQSQGLGKRPTAP